MKTTVTLKGKLTIDQAAETAEKLKRALQQAGEVIINMEGVTVMDISAVQLYVAAKKEAENTDIKLSLKKSAVVDNYLQLIGVDL